jgi:hypothetical protein
MSAQTFKAHLVTGLNASQIEGDRDAGYNKLDITGGIGVGFNISERLFLHTDFLYSRRGSKNAFLVDMTEVEGQIVLDYIDLPIIMRLGDWYQEEGDYNKVWAEGGISLGRLINARIEGSNVPELVNDFRSNDLSIVGGIGYNINEHFFVNLRYTRSLIPLYSNPEASVLEVRYLTPYFLTLRVGYTL